MMVKNQDKNDKTIEKRSCDRTEQVAMIIIVTLFVLSLIPIFYVGLHTYPTGDDYWYGKYVARALRDHHSVFAAIGAAFATVREFYYTWQGTWYSIFLFCFNPELFVKGGYKIVPLLAIALLGGGLALLMYQTMVRQLKLSREIVTISFCVLLFQMLQYMPRTTSGIYWYNGVMHYNANTFTSLLAISMMIVFLREGKKYAYVLSLICMLLIGGGNYQAALMTILFWPLLLLIVFFSVKQGTKLRERVVKVFHSKRVWLLGIGILLELPGIAISAKSPGNSIRSEEFEISLKWALQSVYYSIDRGIYLVRDDFYAKFPSMLFFIVLLAILLWFAMWEARGNIAFRFPMPAVFVVYMCGIYWAMYTPGIFSKADVSGGVPDTIQQVFLITSLANVIYVIGYIQRVITEHIDKDVIVNVWLGKTVNHSKIKRVFIVILMCGMFVSGLVGYTDSTDKLCVDYVKSGHMRVYDAVRKEQIRILEDESVKDACIPELFGYEYYPVCHIQAIDNPEYQLNKDISIYYGKNSVVAYDFREWFDKEGLEY